MKRDSPLRFRVTSVKYTSDYETCFRCVIEGKAGTLLPRSKVHTIIAGTQSLPILPATGQLWSIDLAVDKPDFRKTPIDGYIYQEYIYKKPTTLQFRTPNDDESLVQFLINEPSFRGIGERKARKLVRRFGRDLPRIAISADKRALTEHNLLSEDSATALIEGFSKYKLLRYARKLSDLGIPMRIQQRLFRLHSEKSLEEIERNPFTLLKFGMKFEDCSRLAFESFSIPFDDKRRLTAAIEAAMIEHCSNGNTVAELSDLKAKISRIANFDAESFGVEFEALAKDAFSITYLDETGRYHNTALLLMETVIAKRIWNLASASQELTDAEYQAIIQVANELPYKLAERQLEAVELSVRSPFSCILGGAGTGKTTVLRTVARSYAQLGFNVKAIALSGRAAQRLGESLGMETSTIAKFLYDELDDHKKPGRSVIIIDEASMVDVTYLYRIVQKTDPDTRIILCGDPYQLAPIGPGLPFHDISESMPEHCVELDIVQRQEADSGIPGYTLEIRKNLVPAELSNAKVHFIETSHRDIAQVCSKLYAEAPIDSRIITPTRALAHKINIACQALVNPVGEPLKPTIWGQNYTTDFRSGDPVLITKNNYDIDVQNGSLGRLTAVHPTNLDDSFGLVQLDDTGNAIELTRTLLDTLQLGYAITLHKAQGSQFPRIIVAVSNSQMVDATWLYTAITRAEAEVYIVGSEMLFRRAVERQSNHKTRKTHLGSILKRKAVRRSWRDLAPAAHVL